MPETLEAILEKPENRNIKRLSRAVLLNFQAEMAMRELSEPRLTWTILHIQKILGVTQRELAKRLGVTPVHLCKVIKGCNGAGPNFLDRLYMEWEKAVDYEGKR